MEQVVRVQQVVFTSQRQVELQEASLDPGLAPHEVLVRARYSIVSPGTEGAGCTGLVDEMPVMRERMGSGRGAPRYPQGTGYGHLGEALAVGDAVEGVKVGDTVVSFARHASLAKVDTSRFCLPVPPHLGLDDRRAVFARMAAVAASALRTATVSPGDKVLVIGLGLVGNFAAQLFRLAGADVLATDTIDSRRAIAAACGITRTANPATDDLTARVLEWTDGAGADITVEAIGRSELIAEAVELTRRYGEVVLLGSPRARATFDVTPMLTRIHFMGITIKGSLEWLYPTPETEGLKHSVTRNCRDILGWIASERVLVDPLRTHLLPPERCAEAYEGLMEHKDHYLGVVFDWTGSQGV